jgi:hypothetical protein
MDQVGALCVKSLLSADMRSYNAIPCRAGASIIAGALVHWLRESRGQIQHRRDQSPDRTRTAAIKRVACDSHQKRERFHTEIAEALTTRTAAMIGRNTTSTRCRRGFVQRAVCLGEPLADESQSRRVQVVISLAFLGELVASR